MREVQSAECRVQRFEIRDLRSERREKRFEIRVESENHSALCSLHSALPRSGYTLIEVLVALALLVIGVSALASMTSSARRSAVAAQELSTAQLACQTRVNEMLSGVRTITPIIREPVTGLENWFLSVELFPASKPGVTALRVQMFREQRPGETSTRVAGADFFEITRWINNSQIDSQLLQTMQRNPYALTVAGMTPNPMSNMPGGPANLVDSMMAGAMPGMGYGGGMMPSGMMPQFDGFGAMAESLPPLSLGDDTGSTSSAFTTSEQRRAWRESRSQNSNPTAMGQSTMSEFDLPDAPPPLEIPFEAPFDTTPPATTVTEPPPLVTTPATPPTIMPPLPSDDAAPVQGGGSRPQGGGQGQGGGSRPQGPPQATDNGDTQNGGSRPQGGGQGGQQGQGGRGGGSGGRGGTP